LNKIFTDEDGMFHSIDELFNPAANVETKSQKYDKSQQWQHRETPYKDGRKRIYCPSFLVLKDAPKTAPKPHKLKPNGGRKPFDLSRALWVSSEDYEK
jgi:hypothetical protein